MSFVVKPKLKVCIDCSTGLFSLYDVTGPWDATLNPYGWAADGSGDGIELDQVLSSGLTITAPTGTVYGPYSLLNLTITTAAFTVPAVGSDVTITVSSTSPYYTAWLTTGLPFYIAGAGYYRAVTVTATSIVATNLGSTGNAVPTTVIALGKNVGTAILPSLNGYSLVIDPADILGTEEGEAISDGVWLFDWTVSGEYSSGPVIVFQGRCAYQKLSLCSVECCTDKLMADSDVGCACSKGGNKKSINAHLTLASINYAWRCGKVERAKSLLTKLQDLCNNNCKNC